MEVSLSTDSFNMSIPSGSHGADIDDNKENQDVSRRRISVLDLVTKRPENTNEFFVEVNIVWSSECTEKSSQDPTRRQFLLADDTGHIEATLPLGLWLSVNTRNICYLLKTGKTIRIQKFQLETIKPQFRPLIRKQHVKILFSYSSKDILEIPPNSNFYRYLPFDFTELLTLDHCNKEFVDIIGFAVKVDEGQESEEKHIPFDKVVLSSCRSKKLWTGIMREVALFGDHMGKISKNQVYAMLNVKISDYKDNKSLRTNSHTVILRLTTSNHFMIPPNYLSMSFVQVLITPEGKKKRVHDSAVPTERQKILLRNQTDQKDTNQEGDPLKHSAMDNKKSHYKLKFGIGIDIKHDVIQKISSGFVSKMITPDANTIIILELSSLAFWDDIEITNLRNSKNISEQKRMCQVMDLIGILEPHQIKASLEKLLNLKDLPRQSERLRGVLEEHYPGSVIFEDE